MRRGARAKRPAQADHGPRLPCPLCPLTFGIKVNYGNATDPLADPSSEARLSLIPPVHSVHARRDRVVSLPPCRLYGAAVRRAAPLGPGRALTLPYDCAGLLPEITLDRTRVHYPAAPV